MTSDQVSGSFYSNTIAAFISGSGPRQASGQHFLEHEPTVGAATEGGPRRGFDDLPRGAVGVLYEAAVLDGRHIRALPRNR